MTLWDVNLLLYAYDTSSAQHTRARAWLEERLSVVEAFGFAWATLLAFVRLVTDTSAALFDQAGPARPALSER